MKRMVPVTLAIVALAGMALAQRYAFSGPGKPYDAKTPPAKTLPQAYAQALAFIGPATNRFWCVSASCVESPSAGWVLWFSNTNGQRARVDVYFGEKGAHFYPPDSNSAALLK
jgi:hypothetical protein